MSVYFCSDHHFNHKNIIKYANRDFSSVEEMNEALIDNHNKIVKPGDEVFFLGDFSFSKDDRDTIQIIKRLNGSKTLILGNHDRNISDNPSKFTGPSLFRKISSYEKIKRYDQKIILFHYATRVWDSAHHGSWQLYGHSHGSLPGIGKQVDVGVDAKFITDEYRPVSFEEVKIYMDKQVFKSVDHHVED